LAEQAVVHAAQNGVSAIILRPHLIWGPEDNHLVPRILKRGRRLARIGKANKLVDTIYIDNAADAHILALDSLKKNPALSGRTYFVSQDDPVPMWDMINGILKAGGQPPIERYIPYRLAWCAGAVLECLFRILPIKGEPPLTRFLAEELATAHWFSLAAAKRDLGYQTHVSIQEGLQRLSVWLQSDPYNIRILDP
jgi:nucleoside-diphosphate-sugar epimerase